MPDPFIAKTREELATEDQLFGMSGLEFMQAILDGRVAGPPIAGVFDYRLETVEDGRVIFRGAPRFAFSNPMGTVHGGWYGTLLDSCMACAVMTKLPRGAVYTTLEYKVNITRPVPDGMEIRAIGTAQHVGRTTGVANAEMRGVADGKLYATGSTTCIVMRRP
jgi:uncharacterized protein (TIGR00369 family)